MITPTEDQMRLWAAARRCRLDASPLNKQLFKEALAIVERAEREQIQRDSRGIQTAHKWRIPQTFFLRRYTAGYGVVTVLVVIGIMLVSLIFFLNRSNPPANLETLATATAPVRTYKLAFNRNADIYTINEDGTGLTLVTTSGGSCSWSADGTQITFDTARNGSSQIYVVNVDGSNAHAVTDGTKNEALPAWSPDGTRIAFQASGDIFVINTDGSGQKQLTTNRANDYFAAWSPDSKQIVFVSERDGNPEIYTMTADGSNQRRITDNPAEDTFPDWSPDAKQIVFSSKRAGGSQIYVMTVDGSEVKMLTDPATGTADYPTWSPDGTRIAFDASGGIYVMKADGSRRTRLTPNDGASYFAPSWGLVSR
jgi:TolB protein